METDFTAFAIDTYVYIYMSVRVWTIPCHVWEAFLRITVILTVLYT